MSIFLHNLFLETHKVDCIFLPEQKIKVWISDQELDQIKCSCDQQYLSQSYTSFISHLENTMADCWLL